LEFFRHADAVAAAGLTDGLAGKRAVFQGLGNVGYHTAKYLSEQDGVVVTAIIERDGVIVNEEGLNVHDVKQHLAETGGVKGFPGGAYSENGADALEMECDILVPAALESQIHAGNAMHIQAGMIVEAANGPVTYEADQILDRIRQNPGEQDPAEIEAFAAVLGVQPAASTPAAGAEATPMATAMPGAGGAAATAPAPTPTPAPKGRLGMLSLILILCGLLVILVVIAALVLFLRQRMARSRTPETPFERAQAASREAEPTDFTAEGREPPLAQFMATYMKGDDLFDDSFSVDSPSGEFLGECGVGIADTIGVGEPKKVMAFEVWLFDKNDIQTVTKVLMSEHAFNDEAIRQRLATKGEPVLAEVGKSFVLETETLQMVARVVDMEYGDGALPENSYFERLTLELAVWRKEAEA